MRTDVWIRPCDRGEDRRELRRNRSSRDCSGRSWAAMDCQVRVVVPSGLAMYLLPGRDLAQAACEGRVERHR